MIISQILLLIMVVQWIRSQYREQREILAKQLTSIYLDTRDEVVDTMLFQKYVKPVVSDKKIVYSYRTQTGVDTSVIEGEVISPAEKKNVPNEDYVVVTEVNSSKDSLKKNTPMIRRMSDDMILRSVRMMVTTSQDTLGVSRQKKSRFSTGPYTTAFVVHYENRISHAGMKLNIKWFNNPDTVLPARSKKTIVVGPGTPFGLPEASVSSYRAYLIRRISPQIIFALLLLLMTGLAFRLSYYSLREHILLNEMRNEFISNISHELKTPVATLSIALESLGKYGMKNDPAAADEYIRLASIETRRLEDLINRILSQSVLEQNGSMLHFQVIDLNDLIREVVEIMKYRVANGGTLEFIPANETLTVNGDQLFLKGVIANLVDNSIKYCDKIPVIKIFSGIEDGKAFVRVEDNGPGIPPEFHKKIFEKFFRLPSANIHNVKGYGLGLSFASLVMRLHNGSISVRNLAQGCSFIIHFSGA